MPASIVTSPLLGANTTKIDTGPVFKPGTEYTDSNGTTFKYVKGFSTAVTPNLLYEIDTTNTLKSCFAVTSNVVQYKYPAQFGSYQGSDTWAASDGTTDYYGWVAVRGAMSLVQAANSTAGNITYLSSTTGKITTGATGTSILQGLRPTETTTTGTGGLVNCYAILNLCTACATAL